MKKNNTIKDVITIFWYLINLLRKKINIFNNYLKYLLLKIIQKKFNKKNIYLIIKKKYNLKFKPMNTIKALHYI